MIEVVGDLAPAAAHEQVLQAGLELDRVERRHAEVVEELVAAVELGKLRAPDQQEHRRDAALAAGGWRGRSRSRVLRVVLGGDDARRPRLRPSRVASSDTPCHA